MTYRQRQKLKALKREGNTGYFFKGKLHIRDKQDNADVDDASQRIYRTGTRKQNLANQENVPRGFDLSNTTIMETDHTIPNPSAIETD